MARVLAPGRRLLGLALLLCAGALQAQTIESVLAPGPVIQGHAKTENDCQACHLRFDRAAQDRLCLACHKEVGEDLRLHTGLHGRREAGQPCRSCHTDHKGRHAQIANVDPRRFDHQATDFALRDKHAAVDCERCHLSGKRWREAPQACKACHAQDDKHKGGLGPQCGECHDARSWRTSGFDHDRKTRFPLLDKHAGVKCDACHARPDYQDAPRSCVGCHRKADEHKGRYGERCETCHDARAWKPSTFHHDRDTRYPLRDKHRSARCAACHTGTLYVQKLGTTCFDCHRQDDKHEGNLGRACADCHGERSWKEPRGFDHARSRFPLRGAHARVECKDCHADALYRKTPGECIACHRKDDRHQGNLGAQCADCHGEADWKTTRGRFDHQRTRFPLRNAHAARGVACHDCHETHKDYRRTPLACVSCHRRDDRHEATLGDPCEQCHGDATWRVARFDHARTRFALAGGHALAGCRDCHPTLRYKDAPGDCLGCHRKQDQHKATLGAACQDCHNVRAWTLWNFDHARTQFRLEGRHPQVACTACHALPAPTGKTIAAVGSDCQSCHRQDDRHEGRFGRRCEQCHGADAWRPLRRRGAGR